MTTPLDRTAMDLLPPAARTFGQRVQAVGPDGWSRQTPCDAWTVRDLVGHVTAEHLRVPLLLAGLTVPGPEDRAAGHDVLGGQPARAWDEAADASMRAWWACDPRSTVHHPSGDMTAAEYAELLLLDLLVHAWDVGVSVLRPERPKLAAMDRAQVVHVLGYVRGHRDRLAASGQYGTPLPDDGGDGPATLLRLLGRDPAWTPQGATPRDAASPPLESFDPDE